MGESIKSALEENGFGSIEVEMRGNVANLIGSTPSEAVKIAVIDTAKNVLCVSCAGLKRDDRWHEVDARELTVIKFLPTISPYIFSGIRSEDGGVILNGFASSEAERAGILADAEAVFPGKVTDNTIKIATGSPDAGWRSVAAANLEGLAKLESGGFSMNNADSVLTGRTLSIKARSDVNSLISALPAGYSGATNIVVPDAEAENTGTINSEAVCQELFDDLKGDTKINFSYNRAEISDLSSLALIKSLASAASQCSRFRISVDGHTDADGSEAYNLDLSRRRAEKVVKYLVEYGVDINNITGGGYGESRPIANNDTPEGMAKNRRIEFKIIRSK
jgi:OOP family OmpA-OmpF porin